MYLCVTAHFTNLLLRNCLEIRYSGLEIKYALLVPNKVIISLSATLFLNIP